MSEFESSAPIAVMSAPNTATSETSFAGSASSFNSLESPLGEIHNFAQFAQPSFYIDHAGLRPMGMDIPTLTISPEPTVSFEPLSLSPLPKIGETIDFNGGTAEPKGTIFSYSEPVVPLFSQEPSIVETFDKPYPDISWLGFIEQNQSPLPEVETYEETSVFDYTLLDFFATAPEEETIASQLETLPENSLQLPMLELPTRPQQPIESIIPTEYKVQEQAATQTIPAREDSPQIHEVVEHVAADIPHASETIRALQEVGIEKAQEIVSQALTQTLRQKNIKATVAVHAMPKTAEQAETAFTYQIEFMDAHESPMYIEEQWVVDTRALKERTNEYRKATEEAFKKNHKVDGPLVAAHYKLTEQQKSEPLRGTARPDKSLPDVAHDVASISYKLGKFEMLNRIFNINSSKPPVDLALGGKPVTDTDVRRVFGDDVE